MPKDIQGKVVLITGAATGMGKAAAKEFGSLGAKVVVTTGHSVEKGQAVVQEIRDAGGEAIFLPCDISSEESVKSCIEEIVRQYGRLDCAFNNAGVGPDGVRIPYGPLTQWSTENWDLVVDTNLRGLFFCLKYELLQMQQQGKGAIVNGFHRRPENGTGVWRLRPQQGRCDRTDPYSGHGECEKRHSCKCSMPGPHHRNPADGQHNGGRSA